MNTLADGGLARATAWRFGYLFSQAGSSLALFVCLAQVLPTDAFAQAALAQAVLVIVQALGDFGLSQAAVVGLPARIAQDPEARDQLLRGAAHAFWVAAGAALLLTLVAVAVVPASARLPTLLIGPAAAAAVLLSGADGILRSAGEFRRPVVLVTLSRAGTFLAVPAAMISDSAAWASVGLSVGAVAMTVPAIRVLLGAYRGAHAGSGVQLLRAAAPLGAAQVSILAAGRVNTITLSHLVSLRAAAAFEGAWRLFQIGQYVAGGLATGAAPFIGQAVGEREHVRLRRMLLRLSGFLSLAGLGFGAALAILGPWLSRQLLGGVGKEVGDVLLPFALLSPLAFVGFLAFSTLAVSRRERRWVLISYSVGAVIAVCLVVVLSEAHGLRGATTGCAVGWAVAQSILIWRLIAFLLGTGASAADVRAVSTVPAPVEKA